MRPPLTEELMSIRVLATTTLRLLAAPPLSALISTRALTAAALALMAAPPLAAQIRDVPAPVRTWVTAWAGMYSTVDEIGDPETGSTWHFDDNVLAFGAGAEYEVAQGLLLGLEGSYSSPDFERIDDNVSVADGTAKLLAFFATGRLRYGGTNTVGGYLKGMAGGFGYRTPDPAATNFDLALSTGAGLEYRFRSRAALYLEWNRIWAYHEKEGIDGGNTGKHSLLRLGFRQGL
jgi:hypothetical protein